MTPFDVHFQKAPTDATLMTQNYEEGYFYNAMKTKRLKSIAKVTNTTIEEIMKSELFNEINKEYKK